MKKYSKISGMLLAAAILIGGSVNAQEVDFKTAIFAGGCFWCIESDLEHLDGVNEVLSGYTGGSADSAHYKQVSHGKTTHYEAVEVTYDSNIVSYKQLLKAFWRGIDPYDAKGQFCDKGDQYRAAIFYSDDVQRIAAQESKDALIVSGELKGEIVTEIIAAGSFYKAEHYHQDYYKKNPIRYKYYRSRCGRDDRTAEVWSDIDLDKILN